MRASGVPAIVVTIASQKKTGRRSALVQSKTCQLVAGQPVPEPLPRAASEPALVLPLDVVQTGQLHIADYAQLVQRPDLHPVEVESRTTPARASPTADARGGCCASLRRKSASQSGNCWSNRRRSRSAANPRCASPSSPARCCAGPTWCAGKCPTTPSSIRPPRGSRQPEHGDWNPVPLADEVMELVFAKIGNVGRKLLHVLVQRSCRG